MFRFHSFAALLKKELIQLVKDPKTSVTVFLPPVIQLFLLGYAATMDLREVPLGVLDHSRTAESRELIASFAGGGLFKLRPPLTSERDLAERMDRRAVRMALVIPESFARDLASGGSPSVQVIADGRNSFSAGIASGYAGEAVNAFNRKYFHKPDGGGVNIVSRGWYNPSYEARYFMIPSLLATITLLSLTLLVALSFAKEREGGTMDQLLLTPFSPVTLLAGKGVAAMLAGMAQLAFCMVFVIFWFKIPYRGHWWMLALLFAAFLTAAVGLGLAVSVYCSTLKQAMIWTLIFAIPMAMLSGMATPVSSMPEVIRCATAVNPVRWSIEALHRLFLEGAAPADVLPTCLVLAAIGGAAFAMACVVFTRQRTG